MLMDWTSGEPSGLRITLEPEVQWTDIAPLLDELQSHPALPSVNVRREAFRVAAGGPGFDIVPVLLYITASALVFETVRDLIYPRLKATFYAVYRKLPGMTRSGNVYPMGISIVEGEVQALYRLPDGLSDVAFADAVGSISTHFPSLRGRGNVFLFFTYDPETRSWIENIEASQFQTEIKKAGPPGDPASGEESP
jgi:hypothetical protein